MDTILIVDDDKDIRFFVSSALRDEGYETIVAGDGNRALKQVTKRSPNLVLLDVKLPGVDGIEILQKLKTIDKDIIIIMITAYGNVKGAVEAMKYGAFDYISKPFHSEELVLTIKRALETQSLSKEVEILRKRLDGKADVENLMGESTRIKQVFEQVKIIAPTNMTVIVQGESGAGKELVAQMIHQESIRKEKPFVAIDSGAIPDALVESELFGYEKGAFTGADTSKEGKFEQAHGGTLFLDEITNLPEAAQVKLLRVVEGRKLHHIGGRKSIGIDVRIIVATNTDLSEVVRRGKLREDLFHRLNEFHIELPPLRERKEDIAVLSKRFLEEANEELGKNVKGFSSEAVKLLLDYHWPGNVRELKNTVKKAVLLAGSKDIVPANLSLSGASPRRKVDFQRDLEKGVSLREITKKVTREVERDIIKRTLEKANGNKTRTAKILKIDRMTLYSKLKEFQL